MTPTEDALRDDRELSIRGEYERLHPDDSFDDFKRPARFSREDKGLLRKWLGHRRSCAARPLRV